MPTTDEFLRQYKAAFDELWHRIQAVQALHVPVVCWSEDCSSHGAWCLECTRDWRHPVPWPCDTSKAAEGDDVQ